NGTAMSAARTTPSRRRVVHMASFIKASGRGQTVSAVPDTLFGKSRWIAGRTDYLTVQNSHPASHADRSEEDRDRFQARRSRVALDDPLVHHRIGDLQEARDVRAVHVVPRRRETLGRLDASLVDALHDDV